jgi:ribosomal protein L35
MLRRAAVAAARIAAGVGAGCSGRAGATTATTAGGAAFWQSAAADAAARPRLLLPAAARTFTSTGGWGSSSASRLMASGISSRSVVVPGGCGALLRAPPCSTWPLPTPTTVTTTVRSASTAQKQTKAAGGKMKTVSSWKRRFKRLASPDGSPLIARHKVGHRHRRTRHSPAVRRRRRAATTVDAAWAARMARRGFVRAAY